MNNRFIRLLVFLLIFPQLGFSQDNPVHVIEYEVNRIYPPVSITKENLNKAKTLEDINKNYPSSWVKEYLSVEISAICNGSLKKAVSKNDNLTESQIEVINMADLGNDISVLVKYLPDNTLSHNDIKEIDFSFIIDPDSDAQYADGQQELLQYLKEKVIDYIPPNLFQNYKLAVVKFAINEEGQIVDPSLLWSSDDEKIDELLVETVCNMPVWKPAKYADGTKVRQEFALTVGDMKSCVVNLLNIGKKNTDEQE